MHVKHTLAPEVCNIMYGINKMQVTAHCPAPHGAFKVPLEPVYSLTFCFLWVFPTCVYGSLFEGFLPSQANAWIPDQWTWGLWKEMVLFAGKVRGLRTAADPGEVAGSGGIIVGLITEEWGQQQDNGRKWENNPETCAKTWHFKQQQGA